MNDNGTPKAIARSQQRDKHESELRERSTRKIIEVYVCPTVDCTSYFGHDEMGHLESEFTGPNLVEAPNHFKQTGSRFRHNRAECPNCRSRGLEVQRVRVQFVGEVPLVGPPTPPLPAA